MTDGHWQFVIHAELDPALLIVLQSITRTFHLDHAVALLVDPELHQVGQT